MAKSGIRNTKLYDYILHNYVYNYKQVTQQQIANRFGLTLGAIKNFMYRYNLNKKDFYQAKRLNVSKEYSRGKNVKSIAKEYKVTPQYIYYILNKSK